MPTSFLRRRWTRSVSWLLDRSDASLTRRLAGTAFVIRLGSAALLYLSQVFLARWMGTFEFGTYVYVWTWVLFLGDIMHLGLAAAAQRFIPEYTKLRTFDLLRGFLSGSRWLVFGMACSAGLLGALVVHLAEPWLDRAAVVPLYLACATLPFYALSDMLEGIARSYGWMNLALLPGYAGRPLLFIGLVVLAYGTGAAPSAICAMQAAILATVITAVVQLAILNHRLRRVVPPGARTHNLGAWFGSSVPIFVGWAFYTALTYSDVLLLQQFRPADEVALYYAAAKTLALVAFVYFAVGAAVGHRFAEHHVAADTERLASLVSDAVRWTFWPSLALTAAVLMLGKPLLSLFGPRFAEAYPLMFILAPGLLARAAIGPSERLLNMSGQQSACVLAYASAFAVNVAGCLVLVPEVGIAGGAFAMCAALISETILLAWLVRRRLGLNVVIGSGGYVSPAGSPV